MRGAPMPLSSLGLLGCLASLPLQVFKVMGLIHWQALKLTLGRLPYRRKPAPPAAIITN
jgi:DUF1365 family protein